MKIAIVTVFVLLGLFNSEVLTLIVLTPIAITAVGVFFIKAGEGGAFK